MALFVHANKKIMPKAHHSVNTQHLHGVTEEHIVPNSSFDKSILANSSFPGGVLRRHIKAGRSAQSKYF